MSSLGHNSGLSPEAAREAMKSALGPWEKRCSEFEEKAKRADIHTQDAAEAGIDFIRMARALREEVDRLRDEVREPYRQAAQAATNVADNFQARLDDAIETMQIALRGYQAERRAKAEAREKEQREVERRLAREAAEREGVPPPPPAPEVEQPRKKRRAPAIKTDLGGRMVEQDRWRVEVTDPTKVPDFVLKSPKVVEAIRIVARDFIKNGLDVPGCEKVDFTATIIS